MPSVDRVGRYFPLTLATSIQKENGLADLFVSAAGWFERLEHLALSCLEDGFDLDTFDGQLRKEALPVSLDNGPVRVEGLDNGSGAGPLAMHVDMEELDRLPDALSHLGSCLLARLLSTYSLWSTSGSELVQPCLLAYQGLPPSAVFAELISGEWSYTSRQGGAVAPPTLPSASSAPQVAGGMLASEAKHRPGGWQWHSTAATSVGKVRAINEDSYLEHPSAGIWVVADGMGGHWAGEVASKAVVDAIGELPAVNDLESAISGVSACLRGVNDRLITMAEKEAGGRSMGSTVVAMLARGNQAAAVWAGDSRLYRLRGNKFTQLTEDHSLVAEMARHEAFAGSGERETVNSNVITRAVGAQPELVTDAIPIQVEANDIYLLCSDGLVREVQDDEISSILRWHEHDECASALVELALDRGAKDNVTVIVVWPERVEC